MRAFAQKENRAKERIPSGIDRSNTATPEPIPISSWQLTIGNQVVQRLPQTKDKGLEADPTGTAATTRSAHDFSQTPTCAETPLQLQPKLTVNAPGDFDEQEADRAAEQVMRMSAPRQQFACPCGGGCPKCQEGRGDYEHSQMKGIRGNDAGGTEAPPVIHEVLSSPGRPLDSATRGFMEHRFGQDFGRVRVHTGERASKSAEAVKALAYTVGHDIVFRADQYRPGTATGKQRLLAHELAHVVQQRAASAAPAVAPGVTSTGQRLQRQTPPAPPVQQAGANEESRTVRGILARPRQNITRAEEALRNPALTGAARNRLVEVLSWARSAEAEFGATSASPPFGEEMIAAARPLTTAPPPAPPLAAVPPFAAVPSAIAVGISPGAIMMAGIAFALGFLTSGSAPEDLAAQAYARVEAANNALRNYLRDLPPGAAIPLSRPAPPGTNMPVPRIAPPVAAAPRSSPVPTAWPNTVVQPVPGSRTRPRRFCAMPPNLGEVVALLGSVGTADLAEDARRFVIFRGRAAHARRGPSGAGEFRESSRHGEQTCRADGILMGWSLPRVCCREQTCLRQTV
jgi:hypothetical protein